MHTSGMADEASHGGRHCIWDLEAGRWGQANGLDRE